jgi:hypothetical protein
MQTGRNYLSPRMTRKEPFDWLDFTPGFTAIVNLDDGNYSMTPEGVYTRMTDWEMRIRYFF